MSDCETCTGCEGRAGHENGRLPYRTPDGRPLCRSCYRVRTDLGVDLATNIVEPGTMESLARGVDERGKRPRGSVNWSRRPPRASPDLHHTDELVMNGTVMYQQSPPIAVRGTPLPTDDGAGDSSGAVRAEVAAQRVEQMLAPLTEREREAYRLRKIARWRLPRIAEHMHMTLTAVRRALDRAARRVRRDVPQW